jgi:hypothetical protein
VSMMALAAFLTAVAYGQTMKPGVTPFFSNGWGSGAVAFVVECRNGTSKPVRPGAEQTVQMWLDGSLYHSPGYGHMGGLSAPIPPDETWRELVNLQPPVGASGRTFSGLANETFVSMDLAPGRHSVAFECGGARSDDVTFFWNAILSR